MGVSVVSLDDFMKDDHARKYADVINDHRLSFKYVIDFFNNPVVRLRLEDSEIHHKRPALAGAIVALEQLPTVKKFLETEEAHSTMRFRQAVGVLVKLHMFDLGWTMDGDRDEAIGRRVPKQYHNTPGSLSKWFTQARHYVPPQ